MSAFIDERKLDFGVEPICRTLGVSASAYYQRATGDRSASAIEDERLVPEIRKVHEAHYEAYLLSDFVNLSGLPRWTNRGCNRRRSRYSCAVGDCASPTTGGDCGPSLVGRLLDWMPRLVTALIVDQQGRPYV